MENPVLQRFRQFIKLNSKNNKTFCDEIEISESTLKSLFQRDALPTTEILLKTLIKYPDLDFHWLFFGTEKPKTSTQLNTISELKPEKQKKEKENPIIEMLKMISELSAKNAILEEKIRQTSELNIAASPGEGYGK